jgi:hypothetical protein
LSFVNAMSERDFTVSRKKCCKNCITVHLTAFLCSERWKSTFSRHWVSKSLSNHCNEKFNLTSFTQRRQATWAITSQMTLSAWSHLPVLIYQISINKTATTIAWRFLKFCTTLHMITYLAYINKATHSET